MTTAALLDDWRDQAACLGEGTTRFFSHHPDLQADALALCRRCPVRTECLAWALEHDETDGIWGGRTPRQLQRLRRAVTRRARR